MIALFFVTLAGLAAFVRPPTYQGTAILFLDERYNSSQGFDLALQAGELMSHHYIQMATSTPVLAQVCSGPDAGVVAPNGPCTSNALAGRVSAAPVTGTSLIAVNATGSDPTAAAALADDVAQGIIDQDREEVAQMLKPQRDYLDGELNRLNTAIQAGGSPAQLNRLEGEYATTYARRQDLMLEEFRLGGNLSLVQLADPPVKPIDPDPKKYLLAGLVAGLLAAILAALWMELRDDRLREPGQLAKATGVPFVMAVPASRNGAINSDGQTYAGLMALYPRLRTILVTAASAGDQAGIGAERLAAIAAEAGQGVLVVPADAYANRPSPEPLEVTLVAAPSPATSARAIMLARSSDVAVVVATKGVTSFAAAERTAALLRRAGTDVAAAILLPPTTTTRHKGNGRDR